MSPCPPRPSRALLMGAEAALGLRVVAGNMGEGAFETELRVQLPPGTHYQAARSSIPVGAGGTSCPGWPSLIMWVPKGGGCHGVMGMEGHILPWVPITHHVGAQGWWVSGGAGDGWSHPALDGRHPSCGCPMMVNVRGGGHILPLVAVTFCVGAQEWWVPGGAGDKGSHPALGGRHPLCLTRGARGGGVTSCPWMVQVPRVAGECWHP